MHNVERGEGVERAAVDLAEGGGAVAGQRRNGVGRGYFGSGTRVSAFEDAGDRPTSHASQDGVM
jgi:hypothetical protein